MKCLATFSVLCGFGSVASAWSIFSGAAAVNNAATLASEAAATESTLVAPPGFCVQNFSKDDCKGAVEPGNLEVLYCDTSDECRSIRVTDAVYKTELQSSNLACWGPCDSKCDEFPDGTLVLKFNYDLRADSCCPYRGSWEGQWEYYTVTGLVYGGTAHGTIGVGTNRKSECPTMDDQCEECYDVKTDGDIWFIGFEGSFRGQLLNSPTRYPDELNFTNDGHWIVEGANFADKFRVTNRLDGAHIDYCP